MTKRTGSADIHIANRIRERRTELGMTQKELATLLGVTYQQLHKREKALNRTSAADLWLTAKALDVEVSYFFEGLQDKQPTPKKIARLRAQANVTRRLAGLLNELSPTRRETMITMARMLRDGDAELRG
jgi:transcriptional regulator with XRE-family HTH domain